MRLFDTHSHIQFRAYKDDREETIRRAQDVGVFMVTVGTQADTSRAAVELAEKTDGVWATVGLHPNHTVEQEFTDEDEEESVATVKTRCEAFDAETYRALARHPKCVGIGECGLDFYRVPKLLDREVSVLLQKEMLRRQVDLATEVSKPLVVHCRDAHKEQFGMLKEAVDADKLPARGVIHCFTGTKEDAENYLSIGFYLSFSGVVTFPPRRGEGDTSPLAAIARDIPSDRLLIETDAPYLAPAPERGHRNEPAFVRHTAEFLANLRGISLEELAQTTTANALRVFSI